MSKRIRAITLSCVTVLCCVALIVGGTYALFSDSVNMVNHLQAGELKVQLYRDELSGLLLSDEGLLEEFTDTERVEFSKELSNIFGLDKDTKIVPGCDIKAKFTLENTGNVAIGYYLEFVIDGEILAEQLQLTLKTATDTKTVMLSELGKNYTWGSENAPLGQILLGKNAATFSVELNFVDNDAVNNSAQNQLISVDMIVHAIQLTSQK